MLTVKKDCGYIYSVKDGREEPFFWLGDTAWLMLQKLSREERRRYFNNRAERHYNVIQSVLVHNMNVEAEPGSGVYVSLDRPQDSREYWDRAVEAALEAAERGLYMAYLPVWGSMVKQGYLNLKNAESYARFLAERLGGLPNLIWVLGGDIRGNVGADVWRTMGRTLKSLCPDTLITFHPFGRTSSAMWFCEEPWLDINMFQSGHRRYDQYSLGSWDDNKESEDFFAEDNWRYVRRDGAKRPRKPILDGEPSYEHIPQGLHDFSQPFWEAKDVRRYAYWSVFEGACGHTYGCSSVMQFYKPGDTDRAYNAPEYWYQGIELPGGRQMKYLHDLMCEIDFVHGRHDDTAADNTGAEKYDRITAFSCGETVYIYNYSGREFELNPGLCGCSAEWFDPTSGKRFPAELSGRICPPRNAADETDMVLIVKK